MESCSITISKPYCFAAVLLVWWNMAKSRGPLTRSKHAGHMQCWLRNVAADLWTAARLSVDWLQLTGILWVRPSRTCRWNQHLLFTQGLRPVVNSVCCLIAWFIWRCWLSSRKSWMLICWWWRFDWNYMCYNSSLRLVLIPLLSKCLFLAYWCSEVDCEFAGSNRGCFAFLVQLFSTMCLCH